MVHLVALDATTANVTNNTFALGFSLIEGPFGLRELESDLTFPPRNEMSWNLSIRTSDIVVVIFAILFLTFAIDRYLFKSRYLVHIGGATKEKDHAVLHDEKAYLDEKAALDLESGQKGSSDGDSSLKPKSEDDSQLPSSTTLSRWTRRAIYILLLLFLVAISEGNRQNRKHPKATPESSREMTDAEEEIDQPSQTSWWSKMVLPPRTQGLFRAAVIPLMLLIMLAVVVFHLLFWPWLLTLFIMLQCTLHVEINPGVPAPWESIAIKSTLHLAIWTIVGVGLLLKPNRIQGMLWQVIKWTHAVNWWLFWVVFESYFCGTPVARWFGIHYSQNTMKVVLFILRPSLVVYLYSGVVRDVFVGVRLGKYIWNNDIIKV